MALFEGLKDGGKFQRVELKSGIENEDGIYLILQELLPEFMEKGYVLTGGDVWLQTNYSTSLGVQKAGGFDFKTSGRERVLNLNVGSPWIRTCDYNNKVEEVQHWFKALKAKYDRR